MLPRATPAVSDTVSGGGAAAAVCVGLLFAVAWAASRTDFVCAGISENCVFIFVTKPLIALEVERAAGELERRRLDG